MLRALLAAALLALASCQTVAHPAEAWVRADRLTHDQLAPRFRAYVVADPTLDPLVQVALLGLLDDWEFRIRSAELLLELVAPAPEPLPLPPAPPAKDEEDDPPAAEGSGS